LTNSAGHGRAKIIDSNKRKDKEPPTKIN